MESHHVANAAAQFAVGRTTSSKTATQPMVVPYNTVWPCFPLTLPYYEVMVPGPPSGATPCYYNAVEKPSPTKSRMFYLDRSVFDLVAPHQYLSLTDPKLLSWYLGLSAEDRHIIQDEGGFPQFLRRHPALDLSAHHVYVKHADNTSWSRPVLPTIICNKHKYVAHSTYCEMMTRHISQKMPPEHLAAYNSPVAHEPGHQAAHRETSAPPVSRLNVEADPAVVMSISLDMELERCRKRGSPELRGHLSTTPGHSDRVTDVALLQSDWSKDEETPSKFCSFNSDSVDGGDGERRFIQSVEPEWVRCPLGPVEDMPCVPTCDVMVSTELPPSVSASTQSERPQTADKDVITEVHMADLDYLAGVFIKLKAAQEERRDKMKSETRKECDCVQRAQRAELRLLALQHVMCRQHCWRLHRVSAEGDQGPSESSPKDPPANVSSVLQKLDSDYKRMRERMQKGVPLEQLTPLGVNSEETNTGASFIPANIVGDVQGNLPSRSIESQECKTSGEENGRPSDRSSDGCQESQKQGKREEKSSPRRVVALVPQDRGEAHEPEEKQTRAESCKELNTSESWYDAKEDLETTETGPDPTTTEESASDQAESSVLCVTNLPSHVTESDVMLQLEKYGASEVCISVLKSDLRVAIVMVSGLRSAEEAARELNGFRMDGRTLYVEHVNKPVGGNRSRSQNQNQASGSITERQSSQEASKLQPPTTTTDISTYGKPPLSCSLRSRKVVCISPTAKATCVPQHYGTMGSFDALMTELTRLHPDVDRQSIIDALVELRAEHQGALSVLPLGKIQEMTSELLTRPETELPTRPERAT
ncbi:RNA-binding protein 44 isoform X2 [Scophthalmus maximus]|uniref:RNA-binding protein 44 isoform X2 n=1 Tax=Scophthalmus maximus TaxID=52904 RepID=UPI001FA832BA|nr:RNA-binding protein 44 isoform X2 [Scophthalmus maximus]